MERTKVVNIIEPVLNWDNLVKNEKPKKKRVCAYCRVSTENEEQKTSYEAQVAEYTARIIENPNWELVCIYADEGISGTSTKKRKSFNDMIEAARKGEIDLIITKSVARFARNTVDCLSYVREFREINVEIFFEKENVYSSDPKVDFLLTIMSSIAQEEARNTSENVKWNIQHRFKNGVPIVNTERFLGYTKDRKGGNLVVIPEEAETVREIFRLYLSGLGIYKIAKTMEQKGYKTGSGKTKWWGSSVKIILSNEKYCGDLIQQKSLTVDYLSHRRVKNKNQLPKFHVENNHESIIDKETFNLVQKKLKERADVTIGKNKNVAKYTTRYPFSAMIVCLNCGRTTKRAYWNYGYPGQRVMQQCGSYRQGKVNCNAKALYQDVLEGATLKMLNELFIKNIDIVNIMKKLLKKCFSERSYMKEIEDLKLEVHEKEKKMKALLDLKLSTDMNDLIFTQKYNELKYDYTELNKKISILESEYVNDYDTSKKN